MNKIKKHIINNQEFSLIEISRKSIEITFLDYGAAVISILVPDFSGKMETVLLAYDNLDSYIENKIYLNATIGPISGRISNAKFSIDNQEFHLEKNFLDSANLHSGSECFAFKVFKYEILENVDYTQVIFKYHKVEKPLGTPGNQDIKITYTIYDSYYSVEFEGTTDKDTLLNITNHNYFNLSGNLKNLIIDHTLQVNSKRYMELDDFFVPYLVKPSFSTNFDFYNETIISKNLTKEIKAKKEAGIDNPFLFENVGIEHKQITLKDPISKRMLEIYTSYPCAVIYTHNFPDDQKLSSGMEQVKHMAICFETQNVPNGINLIGLGDSVLRRDEVYYHKTIYKFSIDKVK